MRSFHKKILKAESFSSLLKLFRAPPLNIAPFTPQSVLPNTMIKSEISK